MEAEFQPIRFEERATGAGKRLALTSRHTVVRLRPVSSLTSGQSRMRSFIWSLRVAGDPSSMLAFPVFLRYFSRKISA
jgi:hypothetical protein